MRSSRSPPCRKSWPGNATDLEWLWVPSGASFLAAHHQMGGCDGYLSASWTFGQPLRPVGGEPWGVEGVVQSRQSGRASTSCSEEERTRQERRSVQLECISAQIHQLFHVSQMRKRRKRRWREDCLNSISCSCSVWLVQIASPELLPIMSTDTSTWAQRTYLNPACSRCCRFWPNTANLLSMGYWTIFFTHDRSSMTWRGVIKGSLSFCLHLPGTLTSHDLPVWKWCMILLIWSENWLRWESSAPHPHALKIDLSLTLSGCLIPRRVESTWK